MKWQEFLRDTTKATLVTLVGPLYNQAHVATGPTVYVDGGVQFRSATMNESFPVVSVGDGDSSTIALDEVLPKEKDFSDLAFVLRHISESVSHIELLGFLGGRRDHELLNFGEVQHFLSGANRNATPAKDAQRFRSARFDDLVIGFVGGKLSVEIHGRFSLVVFEPATVTLAGACSYTLLEPTAVRPVSSLGLSNMGFGTVLVECDRPCFLFLS